MADVGLGYLRLGQPLTTLSGGERQRLKLATDMGADGGVYVLDEPTTGLHLADLEQLLGLLDRLVDSGKSVIVIEHHQAVMAHADWIIDLGPGAGHDGGRIVFEGTPADLVAARSTLTGQHLAAFVGGLWRLPRQVRPSRLRLVSKEVPMSKSIRQIHRWLSIAFTVTVIANFVAMSQGQPPAWVTYAPLLPLALLLFSGLYLFVLPYVSKWRGGRPTA